MVGVWDGGLERVGARCGDRGRFCAGCSLDEFGVAVPLSSAGVAAPAIDAAAAVAPLALSVEFLAIEKGEMGRKEGERVRVESEKYLVVVVYPAHILPASCLRDLAICLANLDLPLTTLYPSPARGTAFHLGQLEVLLFRDGVEVLVCPGRALVG